MAEEFTLDDLLREDDFELEELQQVLPAHFRNLPSDRNRAAVSAALAGEGEDTSFQDVLRNRNSEFDSGTGSVATESAIAQVKANNLTESLLNLQEVVADEALPDRVRVDAAKTIVNSNEDFMTSREILQTSELISPSGTRESVSSERVRFDVAEQIGQINAENDLKQSIINYAGLTETDSTGMQLFKMAGGTMVPLVEEHFVSSILEEFGNRIGEDPFKDRTFTLMGDDKEWLKERLRQGTDAERIQLLQTLADVVEDHKGIVFTDDPGYLTYNYMRDVLSGGSYGTFDQYADNVINILDWMVVPGTLGRLANAAGISAKSFKGYTASELIRSIRPGKQPSSVATTVEQTNPADSKKLHEAVADDVTGELADSLYGVDRNTAVAGDKLPDPIVDNNSYSMRTHNIDSNYVDSLSPDKGVINFAKMDASLEYFPTEKALQTQNIVNDFESVVGVRLRNEMSQFGGDFEVKQFSDGVQIKAVYGPREGAYLTGDIAMQQALFAFRKQGLKESDVTLLRREGTTYVDYKEIEGISSSDKGPWLFKIDMFAPYSGDELAGQFEPVVTKRNWLDKLPPISDGMAGSLQQHIFDTASTIDPRLAGSAISADLKNLKLQDDLISITEPLQKAMKGISPKNHDIMQKAIQEANYYGIDFNYAKLMDQGLSELEIEGLKSWKRFHDTVHYLENDDLVRLERSMNSHILENQSGTLRLIVRPQSSSSMPKGFRYYDADTDQIKTADEATMRMVEEQQGQWGKLRRPERLGEDTVEYVLTSNKPGATFFRKVSEGDQLLNYRKGYYQVKYKNPIFVDKITKNSKGEVLSTRAVANMASTSEADQFVVNAQQADAAIQTGETFEYVVRRERNEIFDPSSDKWDLDSALGRVNQRFRGDRLEGSTLPSTVMEEAHIASPVDSMIATARSVSSRVSLRRVIETAKQRWLRQFGNFTADGKFPLRVGDIRGKGDFTSKEIADARTNFNAIRAWEHGYKNSIDDLYKAASVAVADALGGATRTKAGRLPGAKQALTYSEKAVNWFGQAAPTKMARGLAHTVYVTWAGMRQFFLNSKIAVQLTHVFPQYVYQQRLLRDLKSVTAVTLGVDPAKVSSRMPKEEFMELLKDFKDSGIKQSLNGDRIFEGATDALVDGGYYSTTYGRLGKAFKMVGNLPTTVGGGLSDMGNYISYTSSWLAYYDRAKQNAKGRKLTKEELANVAVDAINFTGNYTRSGVMPQNSNMWGVFLQFSTAPHKGFLLSKVNRRLSRAERARLLVGNALLYTMPPAFIYNHFANLLPEDRELANAIVTGFEGMVFNKALELMTGSETLLDYGSAAPDDITGIADLLYSTWTTDMGRVISNTPSLGLVWGSSPKITDAVKTANRFFNFSGDYSDDPTEFEDVVLAATDIVAGMSITYKALFSYETGKMKSSTGAVTDFEVTPGESLGRFLTGQPTLDETRMRVAKQELYYKSKEFRDDVKHHYDSIKRQLSRGGITNDNVDFISKVYSHIFSVFDGDRIQAQKIIKSLIEKDVKNGDLQLQKGIIEAVGFNDEQFLDGLIKTMPVTKQQEQEELIEVMNSIKDFSFEENEDNGRDIRSTGQ